jgi:hypothetical protein
VNGGGGGGGGGSSMGPAGTTFTTGADAGNSGDGKVVITYTVTPDLSTDASPGVVLGGAVHDTATIANGSSPTGSITFNLYGPGDADCSGTPAFTDTVTVSGNGNYQSADFTPTQSGTYRWTADYSGDADNAPASGACNSHHEAVQVQKANPSLETTALLTPGGQIRDRATLTGRDNSSGQLAFRLYGPGDADCSGRPVFTDRVTISGDGTYQTQLFRPSRPGVYRFTARLPSDGNNRGVRSDCNAPGEAVRVPAG